MSPLLIEHVDDAGKVTPVACARSINDAVETRDLLNLRAHDPARHGVFVPYVHQIRIVAVPEEGLT